jgi:hypothetical protein
MLAGMVKRVGLGCQTQRSLLFRNWFLEFRPRVQTSSLLGNLLMFRFEHLAAMLTQ